MEIKKHKQAEKKLNGALSTFVNAVNEVETAIELKLKSVETDQQTVQEIETEIAKLEFRKSEVIAGIKTKQAEISQHIELAEKLKGFTL